VRPLLKKPNLDPNDPASYRPVSNLGFLSKVVEKIVDAKLSEHVCRHRLMPAVQSAYRPYHSTETAVVRMLNDMIGVLDQGLVGVLVLLDWSAAFDTVDHTILLDVERRRFAIRDKPLHWLSNILSERKQIVRFNSLDSDDITLLCGVPQGTVLGPKRFTEYAEDVSTCFEQH
jgi:Reverse transcriptase (RNA-dependent DNA polymerase)